ncbi:hypothetical protein ABZX95_12505, partial [Streptomyces sp. NPDC004232]
DPNFGLPGQLPWLFGNGNLLGSQAGSIAVLTFVGMWQFTPLHALLYQGGARAFPQVLYQAASIDGAGTVRQFEGVDLAAGTPHRDAIVPPSTVFTPTTPTRGPRASPSGATTAMGPSARTRTRRPRLARRAARSHRRGGVHLPHSVNARTDPSTTKAAHL